MEIWGESRGWWHYVLTVGTVKSLLINKAVQDIGMGRYNWHLFILCGFGWFADKYAILTSHHDYSNIELLLLTKFTVSGCK